MSLTNTLVPILLIGLLTWMAHRFIPMARMTTYIVNGLALVLAALWLLNVSGILESTLGASL